MKQKYVLPWYILKPIALLQLMLKKTWYCHAMCAKTAVLWFIWMITIVTFNFVSVTIYKNYVTQNTCFVPFIFNDQHRGIVVGHQGVTFIIIIIAQNDYRYVVLRPTGHDRKWEETTSNNSLTQLTLRASCIRKL